MFNSSSIVALAGNVLLLQYACGLDSRVALAERERELKPYNTKSASRLKQLLVAVFIPN